MQADLIIVQPPANGQPPAEEGPFPYAAYHAKNWIPVPDTKPFDQRQAERFLASFDELLRQVGQGLLAFRLSLAQITSRDEFEQLYNRLIVANGGLHVWLSPVEAGDVWAAIDAARQEVE